MASGPLTVQLRINADGSAAIVGLRNVQGALDNTGQTARRTDTAMASLAGSFKGLALTAGAALSVGALAQSFIQANLESQRLAKGLTAVAGSATAGAAEMEYISKTADKLGLSLTATGSAYVSLTAATKGTALEGQATRDIFESVSLAMGKLGKSSADTTGALQAIQQMVSKGTVSAEELRGQLGERLPGAFKLAAEAIGVTEAELGKMLEQGDILATDLLPALSQKLNTLYNDGKAVGGLEASWNILNNALDRLLVSADNASGGTSRLADMMLWATGKANAFAEALQVVANWQEGKGFAYGDRDALASDWALRAKLLDEYIVKMKDAKAYADANDLDNSAARRAEGEALIARINEIDARVKTTRADVQAARAEAEALANRNASSMGDDAIRLYREHQSAIDANGKAIDDLNGKYDKSIVKKAEYAKMELAVAEAVKLGTMTHAEGQAKLEAFAAAQDKAAESSRSHAKALSAEAQVVADVEKKYGLMAGQLDAVWKLESGRGKTAGTSSERWVKDLAAGEGHMVKIVGQFQMAEGTAKGLGANMATFNGQADAAGKYLAEAAAKGKTLWEQFAYYHGGPNVKAWGEQTRAYADAAVKLVATSGGAMRDIGQNTGKVITDTLNKANTAVQNLIQRFLPARAAAEAYAQAQQDLANSSEFANLSQEEQSIILQGLQQDLEKSKTKATETASAWSEVWKNAVKRIDDTFAGLWKDLFSGTKSTLESLKGAITSWLAEVAHALLTKPLVVAITTAMTGGSSVTGAAGTAGTAGQAVSGLSSFSSVGSMFSTAFSLGSTFLSGVAEGITGMFTTNMFSTLSTAWGAATSGSAMGAAAGAGVIAAYALPLVAAGALILNKYFKDQEPRTGAYGATTTGRTDQFEDEVGVKGGFGLTFGMNDMGTANVDAEEMRKTFEGFAAVSTALADFYGKDVSSKVEASLKQASMENWGKNGLMNYAMTAEQAFQIAFTDIIKHAAATGDAVAVVMSSVVGSLQGTLEDMADQIERGMLAAKAAVGMAEAFQGQAIGDSLGLGAKDTVGNALKLVEYANAMKLAGETTAEAMGRLALNLTSFDAALTLTGTKTDATGMAFIDLANSLAQAADDAKIGVKGLLELQGFYAQQFLGPQVAFANAARAAQRQIDQVFADLAESIAIPGNRDAFMDLVESLDLTTTAGQALYVELMKLGPAFDALFDAQEAFTNWLDPIDPAKKALQELGDVFGKWGMTLPTSKNALLELYRSGKLSTEQMAILGSHLDALKLIFPDLVEVIDSVGESIVDLTDLHIRLARTLGDEGMASWLERQRELASAGDDASRAMLLMIYAAEDLAKQVGKDGQRPNFNTVLLTALGREMGKGFANFDPNGDQATTPAELATALGDLVGGKELTKLMASLDKNSDGQLSVLEQLPLLIAANLAPLFEQFDTNKDGGLSLAELRTSLNGVVDEQQLKAIYDLMDVNGDGLVDKLEAVRLSLYTSMRDIVSAVDTTGDKQLSPEELLKTFKNASDPEAMLKRVYDILDRNQDGLINALEAIPLSIAGGLADKFALIDTSGDLQLSFDELKAAYGDMASDDQLTNLIRLADLNGDGQISAQEAGNMKLDLIALKADKLSDVVQAIRDQETAFLIGIHDVETAITTGLNQLASGLGITDSAKSAALAMPLNLIQEEAGNSVDLRVALQELRSELQALRQSQERTETSRQTSATAMQAATANLGSAVASIPARIEVIVPALSGEAGY